MPADWLYASQAASAEEGGDFADAYVRVDYFVVDT